MSSKKNRIPRGIRNNNPLNVRIGNNWVGEREHPKDPFFEEFKEMKWGVRAAFLVLRNYVGRHKLNTIRKIITRWAPGSENNTRLYIDTVCRRMNMQPDDEITFRPCPMIPLFLAMCYVENGREIDTETVVEGWYLAANGYPVRG